MEQTEIDQLVAAPARMDMSRLSIIGPVGIRRCTLRQVCVENEGHEHNYDHVTVVISGRLLVKYSYVQHGQLVEGESKEYGPSEVVEIKANVRHTIKALVAGTQYMCVFSHRDFDGLVTQTYQGHDAAYD